jgi:hypothetical protein
MPKIEVPTGSKVKVKIKVKARPTERPADRKTGCR